MNSSLLKKSLIAAGIMTSCCAYSQDINISLPHLKFSNVANVNLLSGWVKVQQPTVTIGQGSFELAHALNFDREVIVSTGSKDPYHGTVEKVVRPGCTVYQYPDCGHFAVSFGNYSEIFIESPSGFYPFTASGSTLARDPSTGGFIFSTPDGTRFTADLSATGERYSSTPRDYVAVTKVQTANGVTIDISYLSTVYQRSDGAAIPMQRISGVKSNAGYGLKYRFGSNSTPTEPTLGAWSTPTSIVAYNTTTEYCDENLPDCSFTTAWPTASFSKTQLNADSFELSVVDQGGGVTKYLNRQLSLGEWRITNIKSPSSPTAYTSNFTYDSFIHCSFGDGAAWIVLNCYRVRPFIVSSVEDRDGTTTFTYEKIPGPNASGMSPDSPIQSRWHSKATSAAGKSLSIVYSNSSRGGLEFSGNGSTTIGPNKITFTNNLMTQYREIDGKQFNYEYDARGNITARIQRHSSDSAQDLYVRADFDLTCTYPVKCNKPNWMKDERGNQTTVEYDTVHGGPLRITGPADDNGISPQTRNTYAQRYAWIKAPSGAYVRASAPIWMLSESSTCRKGRPHVSGVGCEQPGDEVKVVYDYGPDSGPNNLNLRGQAVYAGGSIKRTCLAYNLRGEKISETSPNANAAACS
ncbi:MAG: hypothetical protein HY020_06955 [Burkholderiales bacterium]|nr:hypothetical protein [Burkholderiales bacterium]